MCCDEGGKRKKEERVRALRLAGLLDHGPQDRPPTSAPPIGRGTSARSPGRIIGTGGVGQGQGLMLQRRVRRFIQSVLVYYWYIEVDS